MRLGARDLFTLLISAYVKPHTEIIYRGGNRWRGLLEKESDFRNMYVVRKL